MLGDSLSGVTYISVPGKVGTSHFSYLQIVLGYFVGYFIISHILLPCITVKFNIHLWIFTLKIWKNNSKTGVYFLLFRDYSEPAVDCIWPQMWSSLCVRQNVWGQGAFCIKRFGDLIIDVIVYLQRRNKNLGVHGYDTKCVFNTGCCIIHCCHYQSNEYFNRGGRQASLPVWLFWILFLRSHENQISFLRILLVGSLQQLPWRGLDQNMMQKNLSCKSLPEAQKNIFWFSIIMLIVNVFFLSLGVLLYKYYDFSHIPLPMNAETGKVITIRYSRT